MVGVARPWPCHARPLTGAAPHEDGLGTAAVGSGKFFAEGRIRAEGLYAPPPHVAGALGGQAFGSQLSFPLMARSHILA